jgi:diguanylate cyclase (GGDEF)-like protein
LDIIKNKRPKLGSSKAAIIAINSKRIVVDSSPSAEQLLIGWNSGHEGLQTIVQNVSKTNVPVEERLGFGEEVKLWVSAVKIDGLVYIIARDTTLSDKVTDALLKSRILLKELLDGAVDLAFEVNKNREILFVSPSIAFGVETELWIGESADKIFWSSAERPSRNPFSVKTEQTFDAVQVKVAGSSEARWVKIVSRPFKNNDGSVSIRGTMVDITEQVRRERMARAMNLRFKVQERITSILNTAETSKSLLDHAAKALLEVLRADTVWMLEKLGRDLITRVTEGEEVLEIETPRILEEIEEHPDENPIKLEHDNKVYLLVKLMKGRDVSGLFVITRDTAASPWSEQEFELVESITNVLIAAFEKSALIDRLQKLSAEDALTGLLNRGALENAVNERLANIGDTNHQGTLLFIDLDNFKEVNDTLGHNAGDDAIKYVAEFIKTVIRPSDLAGRYGGDEFIIWLEGGGVDAARKRAGALIAAMPDIRTKIGNSNLKLSASVGVCALENAEEFAFEYLANKADAALYNVKQSGKGSIAVAGLDTLNNNENIPAKAVGGQ